MTPHVEFLSIEKYHSQFIASFLDKNAKPFQQLIAPVGFGRSKVTSEIIRKSITEFGAQYILVLTPSSLVDFFADSIRTVVNSISVITVDDRTFRRLVASVPVGENPWSTPVIAVSSIDYAKRMQVAETLSGTSWDLIVVDEAHRLAGQRKDLLVRLIVENKVKRMLLFPISPLDPSTLSLNDIETTVWKPKATVIPGEIQIINYSFGNAELVLINRLKEILQKQQNTPFSNFLTETTLKLASSSLYALEQSLIGRLNTSINLSETEEIGTEESMDGDIEINKEIESHEGTTLDMKDISELLDLIDLVAEDTKYNSLYSLIQNLKRGKESKFICIVSSYASSISYLSSRLIESGLAVYQITGSVGHESATQELNKFQMNGGILLISGVQLLKGLEIEKLDEIIVYDLYGDGREIIQKMYVLLSRLLSGSLPSIYILKETSDVLPYEQRLIEAIHSGEY